MPPGPLTEAFAHAVRDTRKAKGLSQEAAAAACDVERSHYGTIERAAVSPTLDTVWKIAQGLQVPPAKLFAAADRTLNKRRS